MIKNEVVLAKTIQIPKKVLSSGLFKDYNRFFGNIDKSFSFFEEITNTMRDLSINGYTWSTIALVLEQISYFYGYPKAPCSKVTYQKYYNMDKRSYGKRNSKHYVSLKQDAFNSTLISEKPQIVLYIDGIINMLYAIDGVKARITIDNLDGLIQKYPEIANMTIAELQTNLHLFDSELIREKISKNAQYTNAIKINCKYMDKTFNNLPYHLFLKILGRKEHKLVSENKQELINCLKEAIKMIVEGYNHSNFHVLIVADKKLMFGAEWLLNDVIFDTSIQYELDSWEYSKNHSISYDFHITSRPNRKEEQIHWIYRHLIKGALTIEEVNEKVLTFMDRMKNYSLSVVDEKWIDDIYDKSK